MPLFLVHGFRWTRRNIRIFIILNNLSEASADNLMSASTPPLILSALNTKYPSLLNNLPNLAFIEQYNPDDLRTGAQPFAYVADKVIRADLAINVTECMGNQSLGVKTWDAMADLRDELAPDEKVGWYSVYNGDTERTDIGELQNMQLPAQTQMRMLTQPHQGQEDAENRQNSGSSGKVSPRLSSPPSSNPSLLITLSIPPDQILDLIVRATNVREQSVPALAAKAKKSLDSKRGSGSAIGSGSVGKGNFRKWLNGSGSHGNGNGKAAAARA